MTKRRPARGVVATKRTAQHAPARPSWHGRIRARRRQRRPARRVGGRRRQHPSPATGIRLYTPDGARKYVAAGEQAAFLREAERVDRLVEVTASVLR
jgi:hypothetical protein